MQAINEIKNILKAIGANPETIPGSRAGEALIKINAPVINKEIASNEKTENKKV